jgi:hypothetical protein
MLAGRLFIRRFSFFSLFFLVVPFVATRSQLEQEQERVWVRRVVAMTCLKPLKS